MQSEDEPNHTANAPDPFGPGPLLVFSPHLDDAVLSCATVIARHAGTEVVTVFAAAPVGFTRLTAWDAASGFDSARQAMAARRREDARALALLSAHPTWLDFCDSQYEASPTRAQLAHALDELLRARDEMQTILLPAGLFHSDHLLLHDALLSLRQRHPEKSWALYEDVPYRRLPGLLQRRLAALQDRGLRATPAALPHAAPAVRKLKEEAVACYASQLRALRSIAAGHADAGMPERCWLLDDGESRDNNDSEHRRDFP